MGFVVLLAIVSAWSADPRAEADGGQKSGKKHRSTEFVRRPGFVFGQTVLIPPAGGTINRFANGWHHIVRFPQLSLTHLSLPYSLTRSITPSCRAFSKQDADTKDVLRQIGTVRDSRLSEISGIAISQRYKNRFWVHNDSNHPAELFLVDFDGSVLAKVVLKGAVNRDWEDICTFRKNGTAYICVGDVGDNMGRYSEYRMYLLKEPDLDLEKRSDQDGKECLLEVSSFLQVNFRYEDGPKNCEAFDWDAASNSFLLAEKGFDRSRKSNLGIYRLPWAEAFSDPTKPNASLARRVANCHLKNSTAMSISADGRRLVLSSYAMAITWDRQSSEDWASVLDSRKPTLLPLPIQRQNEAITLDQDGSYAFTTSELANQPLWQIRIDSATRPSPGQSKSP